MSFNFKILGRLWPSNGFVFGSPVLSHYFRFSLTIFSFMVSWFLLYYFEGRKSFLRRFGSLRSSKAESLGPLQEDSETPPFFFLTAILLDYTAVGDPLALRSQSKSSTGTAEGNPKQPKKQSKKQESQCQKMQSLLRESCCSFLFGVSHTLQLFPKQDDQRGPKRNFYHSTSMLR